MKKVKLGVEAREKLMNGINIVADAVSATLGPNGRNIIYSENGDVLSTKDGVTVAKNIYTLEDSLEDLGAQLVKQASIRTANNAGDGTTTSTLLSQFITNLGLKALNNGSNAVEIKRGIEEAVIEVKKELFSTIKEEIKSPEQILQIAAISSNNDNKIGALISAAMDKVGAEGVIHIEESRSGEDILETVEGMQFDRGFKSPYFVTNNDSMTCVLENPYVLLIDKRITLAKELVNILNFVSMDSTRSLLIIAEDLDGEALGTLIVNKMRGVIKVCAVKSPDFGDRRKLILEDIATLTGGHVVSDEKGMNLEKNPDTSWLGSARLITVDKEKTTIVDGKGNEEDINKRIAEIKTQISNPKNTHFDIEKLQERLAKFSGGVAVIHVGGNSELEIKEKKDRVDDALNAAQAAVEEGIVPGGGLALLLARKAINLDIKASNDFILGKFIVAKACVAPFNKILTNAGYSDEEIYKLVTEIEKSNVEKSPTSNWNGYDLKTKSIVNMREVGIIDPVKVTRCALENAASIAGTILLTEGVIYDGEKPKEEVNPMMGMQGMM